MEEVITLKEVYKTYTASEIEVHAVNGINLTIRKGEFTAIVGPSGSGKTTLLNLMGGLDSPTSGTIDIAGKAIVGMRERELTKFRLQHIGFIFQAYNLLPVLTAKENTSFIMELQGLSAEKSNQRAEEILKAVGLGERMDARPNKLSGGQQQRVAVARALASRPTFILADEPTANLDSASTTTLLDIMEKMNQEENVTFIFSTHDSRVVKKAHRVITIEDGKILKDEQNR